VFKAGDVVIYIGRDGVIYNNLNDPQVIKKGEVCFVLEVGGGRLALQNKAGWLFTPDAFVPACSLAQVLYDVKGDNDV